MDRFRRFSARSIKSNWFPRVRPFPYKAARIAGFVPVLLVTTVIGLAYFTAVPVAIVPQFDAHPCRTAILLLAFHFIFLNVVMNYALLVFADPGSVPDHWKAPPPTSSRDHSEVNGGASHDAAAGAALDDDSSVTDPAPLLPSTQLPDAHPTCTFYMRERAYDGGFRYCRKCHHYKPDRSHHCSVCGRCILRMDHHCVFINNCVGFLNHKFFISFVFYAFLGCSFVSIVACSDFLQLIGDASPTSISKAGESPNPAAIETDHRHHVFTPLSDRSITYITVVIVGYILTSAFAFALGIFAIFHAYLVFRGRTTIEMYDIMDPDRTAIIRGYDVGAKRNFFSVFGAVPLCWPFPTRVGIPGDGLEYPTSTSWRLSSTTDEEV